MDENPGSGDDTNTRQELLDEVRQLRAALAQKEAELASNDERHLLLAQAINMGYWEWDEIRDCPAYLSKEMAEVIGIGLDELYRIYHREEDFYRYVHPDDLEHYVANLSGALDPDHPRGHAHIFNYRVVRPGGEIRYVRELEYGVHEENGRVIRTYGAMQDVTDLHESTRALVESEERYSSLFSQLPLGVLEQDWS